VDLPFKRKLLARPSKKNYAFTVVISGLTQNGAPLKDVSINRPAIECG
jgi:hypothetical protein